MRPSRIRQRWAEGKPALCVAASLADAAVCELISLLGFDGIWIDMEHHPLSLETVGQMIRAARVGGSDVLARPAKTEMMRMGRILEAGAYGIMYPRCDNATEAKEVVRWAKFAPRGERGFDGTNPDTPYFLGDMAEYIRMANEETFIVIQIESPAAVGHARAIAEVEGVDVIFFGPGDFSLLAGVPLQFDAKEVMQARQSIAKDTLKAGKRFGSIFGNVDQMRELLDMGATLLCGACDIVMLQQGYENLRQSVEPLGFTFTPSW